MLIPWQDRLSQPQQRPLRTLFFGSPEIAVPALQTCIASEIIDLVGVVSQPDRPAGRGRKLQAPAVALQARQRDIPLLQPERLGDIRSQLTQLRPELLVVMAYGKILPRWLLQLPEVAPLNLHASLLPKYRGAAPIQAAILAGEAHSGVTLMGMEPAMDAGPILLQGVVDIADRETAGTLHDKLADVAVEVLTRGIEDLQRGQLQVVWQDESAVTYAGKFARNDAEISWLASAEHIDRLVRAMSPFPGAFTHIDGKLVKIRRGKPQHAETDPSTPAGTVLSVDGEAIQIATGTGIYEVSELQLEGKRTLPIAQFLAGFPLQVEDRFG